MIYFNPFSIEIFKQSPIKDYRLPIKHLHNWFEPITVTKKREDISNLIKELMMKYNSNASALPEIHLPTENGKLVEPLPDFTEEHADFEEDEAAMEPTAEVELFHLKTAKLLMRLVSHYFSQSNQKSLQHQAIQQRPMDN